MFIDQFADRVVVGGEVLTRFGHYPLPARSIVSVARAATRMNLSKYVRSDQVHLGIRIPMVGYRNPVSLPGFNAEAEKVHIPPHGPGCRRPFRRSRPWSQNLTRRRGRPIPGRSRQIPVNSGRFDRTGRSAPRSTRRCAQAPTE